LLAHPHTQLLAERYGVTDPALVVFDPWSLNGTPEEFKGRRLMQVCACVCVCVCVCVGQRLCGVGCQQLT
jgi:hypothetical protein